MRRTIMVHHLHGPGYPPVTGSVSLEDLEIAIADPQTVITFDDGLACQELAIPILKKHKKNGIFFICNTNALEAHKLIIERLGAQFYPQFWKRVPNLVFDMPADFLAEYAFYSLDDRMYRYYRDYVDYRRHDQIMNDLFMSLNLNSPAQIDPKLITEAGFELGLHSYSHPRRMDILEPRFQFDEWAFNIAYVRQFQPVIRYASYPMGRFNGVTKEILALFKINFAFTSSASGDDSSRFELPRTDIKIYLDEKRG